MSQNKRGRAQPTYEWERIEPLCAWPELRRYEQLGPRCSSIAGLEAVRRGRALVRRRVYGEEAPAGEEANPRLQERTPTVEHAGPSRLTRSTTTLAALQRAPFS